MKQIYLIISYNHSTNATKPVISCFNRETADTLCETYDKNTEPDIDFSIECIKCI